MSVSRVDSPYNFFFTPLAYIRRSAIYRLSSKITVIPCTVGVLVIKHCVVLYGALSVQTRQRNVSTCALVQVALGEKVVAVVPLVMFCSTVQLTESAHHCGTSVNLALDETAKALIDTANTATSKTARFCPDCLKNVFIFITPKQTHFQQTSRCASIRLRLSTF